MKMVFVSNFLSHHQRPLTDVLAQECDFAFIATTEFHQERRDMGWEEGTEPDYLCHYDRQPEKARALLEEAQVVIAGSAPEELISPCIRGGKLVLRYSERPLKKGSEWGKYLPRLIKWHIQNPPGRNVRLLCASAYTASDYARFALFRGRAYRWGYFPEFKPGNVQSLLEGKRPASLLWAGRFLEWKHPDDALKVAARLKRDGYPFTLTVIGSGKLEPKLKAMVSELDLADRVTFPGAMSPEAVREYMEQSEIFLFTSDRQEGWGAVLNEAMNSGCCCVASKAAGASAYLVRHGENGILYPSGDEDALYREVRSLLDAPERRRIMGEAAYETIAQEWNPKTAARRLLSLCQELLSGKTPTLPASGPCSSAEG